MASAVIVAGLPGHAADGATVTFNVAWYAGSPEGESVHAGSSRAMTRSGSVFIETKGRSSLQGTKGGRKPQLRQPPRRRGFTACLSSSGDVPSVRCHIAGTNADFLS